MKPLHPQFTEIIQPIHPVMDAFHQAFQSEFESIQIKHQLEFNPAGLLKGKRLRPILFFLCQGLIDEPVVSSVPVALMIELVHTASLLHDDVIDDSHRRRGEKTVNAIFGNHFSVLVGDYLIARMMVLSQQIKEDSMAVLAGAILSMTQAEITQALCEQKGCTDEPVYFEIIGGKTGSLFQAASVLAGLMTGADGEQQSALHRLGYEFGLAFQMQDDILDFTGSAGLLGKPVHQDVLGGRLTLPFIKAFHQLPEKEQNLFRKENMDGTIPKEKIIEIVNRYQGIEKSRTVLEKHSQRVIDILDFFKDSVFKKALTRLIQFNMERHL